MKRGMLRAWMRTLIVQASWNYDRMVGVGVAYAMEPLLRDLPGGRSSGRYAAALRRVAGFFNAHPYLTGMAAGALARVEHDGVSEAQADRLRNALIGPLGSVGDQLIWAGWLPLSAAVGLLVAVTWSVPAGAVTFLVVYNVVHLALRSWGLSVGWRAGMGVAGALGSRVLHAGLRLGAVAALFTIGLALPLVSSWLMREFGASERLSAGAVAALGLVLTRVLVPRVSGVRLGLALVLTAVAVGVLWR
jgi:PTS system mannose-specific IID component